MAEKTYIGISGCGCVTAAMVAGVFTKREEKADLKRWMRTGRRVEITTTDDARERLEFNCPHDKAPTETAEINAEADRLLAEGRSR